MGRALTTGLVAILATGCVTTKPVSSEADPVGCYKVTSSSLEGKSKLHTEADMRITKEITETPWGSFPKVLEGKPHGIFADSGGYWIFAKGQLRMVWSNNNLSGFEVLVRPSVSGFEGIAQEFWDFPPYLSHRKNFFLKRTPCDPSK